MTSRKNVSEGRSTDELDDLLRWALCDSLGRAQPPAYVWESLEQKVRRRMAGGARRYVLVGVSVWEEVKRNVQRRVTGKAGWYAGRGELYQPVMPSAGQGRVPFWLAYIIEQPVSLLPGIGWAT
jgi:hypothetical protein